jgi:hypothetical protein
MLLLWVEGLDPKGFGAVLLWLAFELANGFAAGVCVLLLAAPMDPNGPGPWFAATPEAKGFGFAPN